ncbi:hypothetical protein WA1_13025 [Scytonema hofmannii PCC 7110]|uniref:Antitoxin-like ribbon-helix-helix domain-containing protein n=1 Tax=Scytonema hofmannii PCC 7110 TaxID=128403 RepID=A0A139XEA4_9CYAN|nr:ribbon-helix-helix domain-containing protein [Scytonema hofmannii]KYC43020.1 hypothetical protein WA1_13025 [Scytonema hofmannii PCC 7110]
MKKIEQAVGHNKSQRIIHLPPNRQGEQALNAFVNLKASKQLKQLALNLDSAVQKLVFEALNDLFIKCLNNQ